MTDKLAHGPLSNDRLHQIREILSKAATQSDGGNLGYAMSDAVKAIDELLEVRKVEPVSFDDLRDAQNDEPVSQPYKLPVGWVAVPVEPTEAMLNAWLSEVANWRGHVAGYKAMLAAAPQQEVK
ncbi:hypothetical protein ACV1FS_004079 [Citrobacter koseri]